MKEYIVTFTTSDQLTQYDFAVCNPTLVVNENTTVKEISDWFKRVTNGHGSLEVKLIEPQTLTT